jgi:NADH:ubiquinone oxidoreductase subunit E
VGGAEPIAEQVKQRLQIGPGEITRDGRFSLEMVQCLATCDLAPAIKVNDELYGNLTAEKLDALLSELMDKEV